MSAPEVVATPVEEVKAETPAVPVDTKAEEPAVDTKTEEPAAPVVEAEAEAEVAAEDPPTETKEEHKKDVHKNGFLAKLFSNFKGGDKKSKAPRSPKKDKKGEGEATATAEAPKDAAVPVVEVPVEAPVEAAAEVPAEAPEGEMTAAEPVVAETTVDVPDVKEVPKQNGKTKVGRRLSARVGDFFKSKQKTEITTPARVDEHPPKIDKPEAIAPLENPATDAVKVEETAKPVEASAPVVTATA